MINISQPTYDIKIMLFRAWTGAYTAFLASFSHNYMTTNNLTVSLQAALPAALAGAIAGFGLDQLVFHYTKTTNAANDVAVKALQVKSQSYSRQNPMYVQVPVSLSEEQPEESAPSEG